MQAENEVGQSLRHTERVASDTSMPQVRAKTKENEQTNKQAKICKETNKQIANKQSF